MVRVHYSPLVLLVDCAQLFARFLELCGGNRPSLQFLRRRVEFVLTRCNLVLALCILAWHPHSCIRFRLGSSGGSLTLQVAIGIPYAVVFVEGTSVIEPLGISGLVFAGSFILVEGLGIARVVSVGGVGLGERGHQFLRGAIRKSARTRKVGRNGRTWDGQAPGTLFHLASLQSFW